MGIEKAEQLHTHHIKGPLFEGLIITELIKARFNAGLSNNCFYWRDKTGNEVDCIIDKAGSLTAIEIKSGKTINGDYFNNLNFWKTLSGNTNKSYLIYGGTETQKIKNNIVLPWKDTYSIF